MDPVTMYQREMQFEVDLCSLLQTMKIDSPVRDPTRSTNFALPALVGLSVQDDPMDEVNYHSDGGSDYSNTSSGSSNVGNTVINTANPIEATTNPIPPVRDEIHGCAYLQIIREQLDNYPTTGGEYLEAIFTHREILNSFPAAHRDCARAFTDLAYSIEQRAWRADRDADMDAVTAFRHEAWMIASTL